jgi:hypothetical protein
MRIFMQMFGYSACMLTEHEYILNVLLRTIQHTVIVVNGNVIMNPVDLGSSVPCQTCSSYEKSGVC